jgi:hypothetical protein
MNIVISQPMFLPWIGLFEQIKLTDYLVFYDDVQLPQGRSFMSRVQIKNASGITWLSAPIDRNLSGNLINESYLISQSQQDWRGKHLKTLRHCYAKAPFFKKMYELADQIYSFPSNNLAEFNQNAIKNINSWLGFHPFYAKSSELKIYGKSTQRLVNICNQFQAKSYITGLGALNYIEYDQFEDIGIDVRYMNYRKLPYQQLHGEFTPYVTILDAIANCGEDVQELICSNSIYWKEFVNESN